MRALEERSWGMLWCFYYSTLTIISLFECQKFIGSLLDPSFDPFMANFPILYPLKISVCCGGINGKIGQKWFKDPRNLIFCFSQKTPP